MSGEPTDKRAGIPFWAGEFDPDEDCAHDSLPVAGRTIGSLGPVGDTYCVFRRLLGISSSSSDHSASASTNGFSGAVSEVMGESSSSADGQDSFSALAVE